MADKAYSCTISWVNNEQYTKVDGLAINAPAEYASEVGNLLATRSGTFGAVWSYWGGGKYQVSLRSNGNFDVSTIAKYFGGGGHKNAAGFIINAENDEDILTILQDLSDETNKH